MTSSSNRQSDRVLDTPILVYSLLRGHPAENVCEQFLRGHLWVTSPLILFEAKTVLTKVYGVDTMLASQKLMQVASGSNMIVDLTSGDSVAALHFADAYALDLTDSVLLRLAQSVGANYLATDDQYLSQVCLRLGIAPLSPIDAALRQAIAAWETTHLLPKGVQRVLRRTHQWLSQHHPQAASDFWSLTAGGTHLP